MELLQYRKNGNRQNDIVCNTMIKGKVILISNLNLHQLAISQYQPPNIIIHILSYELNLPNNTRKGKSCKYAKSKIKKSW